MKKNIYIALGVVLVLVLAVVIISYNSKKDGPVESVALKTDNTDTAINIEADTNVAVKEFAIKSFVEFVDGKPMPQYSPTAIALKKGDRVRLKVTVTKGVHDFNIDEYNIHVETPLNEEKIIEFTADKSGEFIYYCNKNGHRAAGHWGTLSITE